MKRYRPSQSIRPEKTTSQTFGAIVTVPRACCSGEMSSHMNQHFQVTIAATCIVQCVVEQRCAVLPAAKHTEHTLLSLSACL